MFLGKMGMAGKCLAIGMLVPSVCLLKAVNEKKAETISYQATPHVKTCTFVFGSFQLLLNLCSFFLLFEAGGRQQTSLTFFFPFYVPLVCPLRGGLLCTVCNVSSKASTGSVHLSPYKTP